MTQKKPRPRIKRVHITLDAEPYERLRINILRAGLPNNFFSQELNRVVIAVDQVVQQLIDIQAQGHKIRKETIVEMLKKGGLELPEPNQPEPGKPTTE